MITLLLASSVQMSVATPPSWSLATSKPLQIGITVENKSKESVAIWSAGFYPNHMVTVVDQKGKVPELTATGKNYLPVFGSLTRGKNFPITIKPGKKHTYQTPDLKPLFKWKPGTFKVTVKYSDAASGTSLVLTATSKEVVILE